MNGLAPGPDRRAAGVALRRAPDPAAGAAPGHADPARAARGRAQPCCARRSSTRPTRSGRRKCAAARMSSSANRRNDRMIRAADSRRSRRCLREAHPAQALRPAFPDRRRRSSMPSCARSIRGPARPMVEIGPGLAALTQPLVERLGKLAVIELDRDLAARLRNHGQLAVIEADVLKVDFAALGAARWARRRLRVVGNLPYNISTPILFHLLGFVAQHRRPALHAAKGSDRPHGGAAGDQRLRPPVGDAAMALRDGERAVRAARGVRSAAARRQRRGAHGAAGRSPPRSIRRCCRELVQVAFSQRRKLLRHTLGKWLEQRNFAGTFDVQRRAEEVPVDEYLALPSPKPSRQERKPVRQASLVLHAE